MMDDLIRRQDVLDEVKKLYVFAPPLLINTILSVPSAQKKGHWIHDTITSPINNMEISLPAGVCSVCDIHVEYTSKFCPHCGADMRGEDDG